jgi:hypothetical protein
MTKQSKALQKAGCLRKKKQNPLALVLVDQMANVRETGELKNAGELFR